MSMKKRIVSSISTHIKPYLQLKTSTSQAEDLSLITILMMHYDAGSLSNDWIFSFIYG